MLARHLVRGAGARNVRALLLLGAAVISGCGGFDAFGARQAAKPSVPATAPPPDLVEIAVGPPNARLVPGTRIQFTATGLYEDGSRRDLTPEVAWTSADPAVAAISVDAGTAGLATGMNPGETKITASSGKLSRSVNLTVAPATLVSISVTPPSRILAKGTRQQFTATGLYSDNSTQNLTLSAQWSAEDPAIASVDGLTAGNVFALAPGATRITATFNGISDTAALGVTPAVLTSIQVTPAIREIPSGLAAAYTATGVYTDGSVQDITASVTWVSTVISVASVRKGVATGHGVGTTGITALLGAVAGTAALKVTDAQLISIAVSPENPAIANGLSTQFAAIGTYTNNSTQDLTAAVVWSVPASTVASISNAAGYQGRAQSAQPGSVTISATAGAVSGTTTLTVTAATLVSLSVTPAAPTIAKGTEQHFTATGTYTDNSTQDLTTTVTWNSSSLAATVSNAGGAQGLATGADVGQADISATLGSVGGSSLLTVTAATLVSITVVPAASSIANGMQRQLAATGSYSDGTTQNLTAVVTWASSNTAVATISNAGGSMGLASSVGVGSTTLSAALDGVTGSTQLTVTPATLVSIAVTPASLSIAKGTQLPFTATGTYTDSTTQNLTDSVTWGSSAPSIAPISNAGGSKGIATAATVGTTTVSATTGSISGTSTLTVTPATPVSIAVTPTSASVAISTQKQFSATATYTDASTQNVTASVTWSSSDNSIATISNAGGSNGLATATNAGTTSIGATLGALSSPVATLAVNNGQAYVYAVNQSEDSVSQYKVEAGGGLTSIGTVAAGSTPTAITIDLQRRYAYVIAGNDNSISEYTVGPGGALTLMGTVPAGAAPIAGSVDPSGKYFYVANFADNTMSQLSIGTGGALSPLGAAVATGTAPNSVAVDPLGRSVYTVSFLNNTVSQFRIGTTGVVTPIGVVLAEDAPASIAVDPTGRYAYVANFHASSISQYSIGTGGALTSIGSVPTGGGPFSVAVDPTGRYVYTADYFDNTVTAFRITSGGTLMQIGVISSGAGPYSVSVDPSGRYVYVANSSDDTVTQYMIDVSGMLSDNGTTSTGAYPVAVFSSY